MNIQDIIADEVKAILAEAGFGEGHPPKGEWYKKRSIVVEEEQNVVAQLDHIVKAAPRVIPELEKFVNDHLVDFLKKSVEGKEKLSEADEDLSDKVAEPIQKAIKGAGQVAKGVAKGTSPLTVPALKLAGHVGSFLPFGKKAGVLIAAAQDKNTPETVRNAILFALTNLLAGQMGMELPDLSSLVQMVPGIPDFDSAVLHSIDDMALLAWAWKKMKSAGIDPEHQLKRFGEFIGRADIIDLADDPAASPAGASGFADDDQSLDARIARAGAAARKGRKFRGVKEMKIKTSDLYRIIQEELEVVLTNEEAEEVFDLDMSALLDEMMNEENEFQRRMAAMQQQQAQQDAQKKQGAGEFQKRMAQAQMKDKMGQAQKASNKAEFQKRMAAARGKSNIDQAKKASNKAEFQRRMAAARGGVNEEEDKDWIQDAEKDIERRGTEGVCTGEKFGSDSCPPGSKRYNLAKTFRKMAKKRKKD